MTYDESFQGEVGLTHTNCRRLRIDPYTYLRELLTRLPHMTNKQIKDVTPSAWAKARKQGVLRAAS